MKTRRIGSLEVSEVGLGCNNFGARIDEPSSSAVVSACLDEGITLFDTADVYGDGLSEEFLGRALGGRREDVIVATKFGWDFSSEPARSGASAKWVRDAAEASLSRLGTDYIDLYQLHTPDDGTPIEETLGALNELVAAGKVREIGCSNFSVEQLTEADQAAASNETAAFRSVQNRYSLLHREPEAGVLEFCEQHDQGFLPYFPLHSGLLTGKYPSSGALPEGTRLAGLPKERLDLFYNDGDLATVDRLSRFCEARDRTLLELAFSWLLARGVVASVIAGATKPAQVASNAAAAGWELDASELAEVDAILAGAN